MQVQPFLCVRLIYDTAVTLSFSITTVCSVLCVALEARMISRHHLFSCMLLPRLPLTVDMKVGHCHSSFVLSDTSKSTAVMRSGVLQRHRCLQAGGVGRHTACRIDDAINPVHSWGWSACGSTRRCHRTPLAGL